MSSGHSRSPCLSFVRRRDGEARESWASCCPAPLQSRRPQRDGTAEVKVSSVLTRLPTGCGPRFSAPQALEHTLL